jgi:hypothetical protein
LKKSAEEILPLQRRLRESVFGWGSRPPHQL